MLNRSVSYKSLLCIIGTLLILYGLYSIASALTAQIEVSGDLSYTGPIIFFDLSSVIHYILFGGYLFANPILPVPDVLNYILPGALLPGPLLYVSIGILCLAVASAHIDLIYWCLLIALWFSSCSFWFPLHFLRRINDYSFASFIPYIVITLILTLLLLACYKPVTHFLRKLLEVEETMPAVHS